MAVPWLRYILEGIIDLDFFNIEDCMGFSGTLTLLLVNFEDRVAEDV